MVTIALKLKTAPAIYPISLTEAKAHLRLDSTSLVDDLTSVQSIPPGAHVIAAAYSLKGTGIDVLGYSALVALEAGTNGAGGTVDCKIQESDTDVDANYTDWTGGAFAQVTGATDNATYAKAYTGTKKYIRTVATVAGAACDFGASVIKIAPVANIEDSILTPMIATATEYCQDFQNRAYITQTWQMWLDDWPGADEIEIPLPPLQSITSIKYYDTDDVEYTLAATEYFVDTVSFKGRAKLNYGKTWPTIILRPAKAVCVEFVAGYGDTAADVPEKAKMAMIICIKLDHDDYTPEMRKKYEQARDRLLTFDRVFPI